MIHVITHINHVIVTGNMKTNTKLIKAIKASPFKTMFIGWLLAFIVPLLFKPGNIDKNKKDTLNYYEISFLSVSALFTGIAFAITYSSLNNQKESLNKQINLLEKQIKVDGFVKAVDELRDETFRDCRRYIISSIYEQDIATIKHITNKTEISLQDFKDVCYKDDIIINHSTKEHLLKSYQMILRFCSKMEYLGYIYIVLYTQPGIIVDYYGRTILNTYGRLKPLIEANNGEITEHLYYYFAFLFAYAGQREEGYYKERENIINSFASKKSNNNS